MGIMPWDSVVDLGKDILDKVFPDKTEAAKAKAALDEAALQGQLHELDLQFQNAQGQIEVNKAEASNTALFVAGWRPFVGWIGGLGLAYASILEPLGRFIAQVGFHYTGTFPVIDTSITMQVLTGILGLGAMRSFEKYNGVAPPTHG